MATNGKVLFITLGERNLHSLRMSYQDTAVVENYKIVHNATVPTKEFTLLKIYNECCRLIEDQKVRMVVSCCDWSSLVHAALKETYPFIRGPSFLSSIVCLNKDMGKAISSDYNTPYRILVTRIPRDSLRMNSSSFKDDMEPNQEKSKGKEVTTGLSRKKVITDGNMTPREAPLQSMSRTSKAEEEACTFLSMWSDALGKYSNTKLNFPAFMKPSLGSGSCLVKKINDGCQLMQHILECDKYLRCMLAPVEGLDEKFLHPVLSKIAVKRALIVEELVTGHSHVCNVDGFIFNGEMTRWVISENVYWSHQPRCFRAIYLPAQISQVDALF